MELNRFRLTRRDLRLGSGLILFVYVTAHFTNHALGLISLAAAERGLRVAVAVWLGRLILGGRARTGRQGAVVNFLVGGLLLIVIGIVPFVGGFITLIATVLGLGAMLIRAQALREQRAV